MHASYNRTPVLSSGEKTRPTSESGVSPLTTLFSGKVDALSSPGITRNLNLGYPVKMDDVFTREQGSRGRDPAFSEPCHAEIQAEFYHLCRLAGIGCRLEVRLARTRADAVIIRHGQIVALVEIKKYRRESGEERFEKTKQAAKYRSIDLQLFVILGMRGVPGAVKHIREFIDALADEEVRAQGGERRLSND